MNEGRAEVENRSKVHMDLTGEAISLGGNPGLPGASVL